MKKQKNRSGISKIYRPIVTVFAAMATAVLASFAAIQLTSVTRQNNAQKVESNHQNPVAPAGAFAGGLPVLVPGHTPSYIYHLGVVNPGVAGLVPNAGGTAIPDAGNFVSQYVWGLNEYGLLTDDVLDIYQDALSSILAVNGFSAIDSMVNGAKQQALNFTDRSTVFSNYQNLNNFGPIDSSKELFITKPQHIYDVYSHGAASNPDVELSTDGFVYKVASVNLNVLKDKKSLVFNYRDLADTHNAQHDYKIVISNQNSEIDAFVNAQEPFDNGRTPTLADLVKAGVIFVRDASDQSPAGPMLPDTTTLQTLDKIKVVYNDANNEKKLDFLIEPDDTNIDDNTAVKFSIDKNNSDKDALAAVQFGFLDNSHSPLHTNPYTSLNDAGYDATEAGSPLLTSSTLIPSDATKIVTELPIHALFGEFANPNPSMTSHNAIQLFMAPGTKIEQAIRYNDQAGDAFDGGDNNLVIEYSIGGDVVDIKPNRFTIKADKAANGPSLNDSIKVDSEVVGDNPSKFAQVIISLPKDAIQFNPKPGQLSQEQPFRIKNIFDRIFFEIPGGENYDATLTGHKDVRLETKTEVTDKDLELIGDIYRNWSGHEKATNDSGAINPAYIQPSAVLVGNGTGKLPGNQAGFATFGQEAATPYGSSDYVIQFPMLSETEQGGVKTLGYSNGIVLLDAKGINPDDDNAEDDTWRPMYHDANGELQFLTSEMIGNGQFEYVDATGEMVTTLFVEFTNMLSRWAVEKLGLPETQVRQQDEYKLVDPSGSIGFVKARIIDRSGADGVRLQEYANALARFWMDASGLTNGEQDIINNLTAQFRPLGIDISSIQDKGKPDAFGNIDVTDAEYLRSRQIIYLVLQPYMIASMNAIINVEYEAFQSKQNIALGTFMHQYLNYSNGGSIGIPTDIITNITPTDPKLSRLNLLAVGNYSVVKTSSGLEELTSLLEFIKSAGLQNKYLSPSEAKTFDGFMENHDFADETMFTDPANQSPLEDFLLVLSKIIGNIVADEPDVLTLSEIVEKISNQEYNLQENPDGPRQDIEKAIQTAIRKISTNEVFGTLSFMGNAADVSYLQMLVMGKNVYEIFNEYLALDAAKASDDKTKMTDDQRNSLEQFRDNSTYDVNELSRLAINLGYYNLPYFIKQLTEVNRVEKMAAEMLHSNLSENIRLSIDTDNQMIKFITDSDSMTKYAFMAIGIGTFTMGTAIFGLSFRKSIRFTSKKSALIERLIFMSIAVFGAILAAMSFIPGLM